MDISGYQHMHIRMSTRGKRPLRNLTPTDKVRAIQRIHNGETKASVSRDIGVPESTLRGWCKNEQKLRFMCRQVGTNEQLFINVPGLEIPPEKKLRFDRHLQPPKLLPLNHLDEFLFNHSPVGGIVFPSNSDAILEKATHNNITKKYSYSEMQPDKPFATQISAIISPAASSSNVEYSQLSVTHNLNLMSLLYPSVNVGNISNFTSKIKSESPLISNVGITESTKNRPQNLECFRNSSKHNISAPSLTVKNWAKYPDDVSNTTANDWNNNKHKLELHNESTVNSICPLSWYSQKVHISDAADSPYSDSTKTALLEWCKVFSASLGILALTTAAAALQPNSSHNTTPFRQVDDMLCKKITNIKSSAVSPSKFLTCLNNDLSSDSVYESEPEDLSLRSTISSTFSSPSHRRSQSSQISSSHISASRHEMD